MWDELQDDVYDITVRIDGDSRFRVYLFDHDRPVLVDTGFAETADAVFEAIEDIGVVPERVLITHCDGDHVGGLPTIVDQFDVEVYLPAGSTAPDDIGRVERYEDGDRIGEFTAVHVEGHTPHHHAVVDESKGVAVLGDAVFGADVRGLPESYFVLPPAYHSVDLTAADENLAKLLAFEFDTGLVYHGANVYSDASEKLERFVNFRGKPA